MMERAEFPVQRNRTLWCLGMTMNLFPSATASRTAGRLLRIAWFQGAKEGAEKFSVHLRGESGDVDSLPGEKFTCIFRAINARRFDFNLLEPGGG